MADIEIPEGVLSDDNVLILFVPGGLADRSAPTVAELTAATVIAITYGIGDGEYNHVYNDAPLTSNRLGLGQTVQYDSPEDHTLEISYVYTNRDNDTLRLALPFGAVGDIVERWAIPNEDEIVAEQLVDVLPIRAGRQRKVMPTRNTELKRIQRLNIRGKVATDVAVVA
ncbi:hypothetical protein GRS96_12360 [Rathayibacter sp. VKM Ac-2803]|uniref:phage tail tube protein n=1 Tax=Rathayibacter sp. VKM Ac-2803 TaxID=2609256 RepID=UPI00135A33E3|nr:hypothetical protein [Rathayibacter sp. VKM Ac-2803]MWV50062.1 hypothetical protein [Rathayibacter sp. VKM Ac-2803]